MYKTAGFREQKTKISVEIQTAAVRSESCLTDKVFCGFDAGQSVVGKDVFFDDNAVDVVGTGVQSQFTQRKSHPQQRNFDMNYNFLKEYDSDGN